MNDNESWIRERFGEESTGCGLIGVLALTIAALAIFGGFAGARQIRGEKSYVGVGVIATSPTPKPTPSPTPEATRTPIVEERTTIIDRTPSPATQAPATVAPAPYCPPGCECYQIDGGWTQVCGGATNAPDTPAPTPYGTPYGSPGH